MSILDSCKSRNCLIGQDSLHVPLCLGNALKVLKRFATADDFDPNHHPMFLESTAWACRSNSL